MTRLPVSSDLAERLLAIAAERGVDVEQLLVEWAEEHEDDEDDLAAIADRQGEPTMSLAALLRDLEPH